MHADTHVGSRMIAPCWRALRRRAARLALLGAAVMSAACLDPVDPGDAAVASVEVVFEGTNSADTINVRGTTRARAVAVARAGYDLGRTDFTFTSSNEQVAVVEATGVVRAISPGKAIIRATLPGGPMGEGEVVVVPSSVEYTIPVGNAPGAMAFSPDYTRLYVTIASDSIAIVDAFNYFRLSAIGLRLPGVGVATTAENVYVTHPASDSVSMISTATNTLSRRISVGRAPTGAAATAERAFIAVRGDRRLAIVEGDQVVGTIGLAGAPRDVAVARDGRRVFATMESGGAWRLAIANPAARDTIHSVSLSSEPGAITTDMSGTRVYVLLPTEGRVAVFSQGGDGRFAVAGSVAVGPNAGGISARLVGVPLVVASGAPVTIFDGGTLAVSEQVPDVGTGHVAIRPDGVFAFIAVPGSNLLRVIGL